MWCVGENEKKGGFYLAFVVCGSEAICCWNLEYLYRLMALIGSNLVYVILLSC